MKVLKIILALLGDILKAIFKSAAEEAKKPKKIIFAGKDRELDEDLINAINEALNNQKISSFLKCDKCGRFIYYDFIPLADDVLVYYSKQYQNRIVRIECTKKDKDGNSCAGQFKPRKKIDVTGTLDSNPTDTGNGDDE